MKIENPWVILHQPNAPAGKIKTILQSAEAIIAELRRMGYSLALNSMKH